LLLVVVEAEEATPALQVQRAVGSKLLLVVPDKAVAVEVAHRSLVVELVFQMVVAQELLEPLVREEPAEPVGMLVAVVGVEAGTAAAEEVLMTMTAAPMAVVEVEAPPTQTLRLPRT
jgi:hypothetical protein